MSLPQRIRQARQRAGLTQQELALKIGLKDRREINQIETRPAPQVLDRLAKLAAALDVSPCWLAFGDANCYYDNYSTPTHFMRLPEPPTQKGDRT